MLTNQKYTPERLLDRIKKDNQLSTDSQLCDFLGIKSSVVSRVRNKRYGMSAELIIRIHDISGMPIRTIKEIAGIE